MGRTQSGQVRYAGCSLPATYTSCIKHTARQRACWKQDRTPSSPSFPQLSPVSPASLFHPALRGWVFQVFWDGGQFRHAMGVLGRQRGGERAKVPYQEYTSMPNARHAPSWLTAKTTVTLQEHNLNRVGNRTKHGVEHLGSSLMSPCPFPCKRARERENLRGCVVSGGGGSKSGVKCP